LNQRFEDVRCTPSDYYLDTTRLPRVIGWSRKSDLHGVLAVHGVLPTNSQPVQFGFFAGGTQVIPLITQLAFLSFPSNSTTHLRVHFLPMNGTNNPAQRGKALLLAAYNNPIV
jgi:hypothetical protein